MLHTARMEVNPYHLKDIDGNYYNKYPEFQVWQEGFKAGQENDIEKIREAFNKGYAAGRSSVIDFLKEGSQP